MLLVLWATLHLKETKFTKFWHLWMLFPLHFATSHNTLQQSQLHTWQCQLHRKHTILGPAEIDRVELHDRSRTIADRLDFWPLSRLDSTLVNGDRLDRRFSWQFSPTRPTCCMIVCVVCELVKPFRGRFLMYRRSGFTDEGLPATRGGKPVCW